MLRVFAEAGPLARPEGVPLKLFVEKVVTGRLWHGCAVPLDA
jgi:hypothetical protein